MKSIHAIPFITFLVSCWISLYAVADIPEFRPVVRIGVLSFDENSRNISRWQPTIDYLNERLPQYQFTLVSGDIKSIDQLVASGTLDFAITNGVRFIDYQNNYEAIRTLNLKPLVGDPQFAIGSAVISRQETPPLHQWDQIKTKRIIATSSQAFGGFQVIQREWLNHGLDAPRDLPYLRFIGIPQQRLLKELADNHADIAILPTCVLEQVIKAGHFKADQFRVEMVQQQAYLPCQSSSSLYPYWTLSRMKHVDETIAREIVQTLLSLKVNDSAAIQGEYQGWTVPINDSHVVGLMKDLDILDDSHSPKILWQKYRGWLLIALGCTLLLAAYNMRVNYLVKLRTRQLRHAIKQHQRATEKIRQQQEQFYSAQRILLSGELAAGLSHELNQPLMAISSYITGCQMRLQQAPLDMAALNKALDNAQVQTSNANKIIRRVRQFIKKHPEKKTYFYLHDAINKALALFNHELQQNQIQVTLPTPLRRQVYADEVLIQQVIVNLICNSIDAIKSVAKRQTALMIFSLHDDADSVTLTLRDTGVGMTDGQRKHLFVPFNTSKHQGIGLGMVICKRIIEAHQGRIWSPSCQLGASISFSLPLSHGAEIEK
ncbi:Sensor protein fixL [Pragia fontium]|uniref:sensor histidine kinase n=1 Tax=Pragia fontium TaxID=82985 RepID=UPI000DFEC6A4|nr:sensor histidine kinase [Pragia fontium]SUB83906.1 Sensor protein fixL [Pragia fontium]